MKKFNGKSFLMGLIIGALVFSSIAVAFAANYTANLKATYRDIKVYVDDKKIDYYASNGAYAEPFIINGTTYVPLRLFSEKIDKPVLWEGETSSIYIGEHKQNYAMDFPTLVKRCALAEGLFFVDPSDEMNTILEPQYNQIKIYSENPYSYIVSLPVKVTWTADWGEEHSLGSDLFWVDKNTGATRFICDESDFDPDYFDETTGEYYIEY